MKCPICASNSPGNARFCGKCGSVLGTSTTGGAAIGIGELPQVRFTSAVTLGYKRYFQFSGRSTRSEYWWFTLFTIVASLTLGIINSITGIGGPGLLSALFLLAIIPSLAVGARRLHDIEKSGWWQVGIISLAIFGWGLAIAATIVAIIIISNFNGNRGLALIAGLAGLSTMIGSMAWWIRWFARKGVVGPNKYGPAPK